MNSTVPMDEAPAENPIQNPGAQLAHIREKKGYSREYVAGKLHLRVRLIELLEEDAYDQMPEPVFVKGYFRAYAKLLGVSPEPYVSSFNKTAVAERKPEKAALWQSKRESHRGERAVRWITACIVIAAVVAVSFWWQKNSDQLFFTKDDSQVASLKNPEVDGEEKQVEVKLTDISKMQSMFRLNSDSSTEK
ncbi:DNA-binding protein [Legionella taurinensis]|uniref:DNA-binding protein n=1 Tax=Legionella taurinensis TaxID=70611 RepID=A0A3A5L9Q7_9GAMM|nr:helix-turn-helix domain-containing protein [Legionella taurinensis]MDX1836890.1 helix-turn-helix domain-containing protein [Legionella taurinensis]PUT41304.1 DNA-binding protein [Legionella taurinensis]PUT42429.1 DNA-binding protein [Legionella taurinensis]PUT46571.1 DNA-binding protein [Legionella taurinensis]PUT47210.1 DNA-binding protein [Legionella taurinensis]